MVSVKFESVSKILGQESSRNLTLESARGVSFFGASGSAKHGARLVPGFILPTTAHPF